MWRGGHDPEMVRKALDVRFERAPDGPGRYRLTLTNVGAAHYVSTGTPDRHFVVSVRLLGGRGEVLAQEERVIKRTVMWRLPGAEIQDQLRILAQSLCVRTGLTKR